MLSALVCTLLALRAYFCAADSAPGFICCVKADFSSAPLGLYSPEAGRDLDPAGCSVRCLRGGCQFTALSSGTCYRGNQLNGLVVTQYFNTSSNQRTKHVKGGSQIQSALYLPLSQEGVTVLYRSAAAFLLNIIVFAFQDEGILGLGEQDMSSITVELQGTTSEGQSSHPVKVPGEGSFTVSSDRTLRSTEISSFTHCLQLIHIDVQVSTLHLSGLQPPPGSGVIFLHCGPLGVPSCPETMEVAEESLSDDSLVSVDVETLATNKHLRLTLNQTCSLKDCKRGNIGHDNLHSFNLTVIPGAEFRLEVPSPTSYSGTEVVWTFSLEGVVVTTVTAEKWKLYVSLPKSGCYSVDVQAFKPLSRVPFQTQILLRDPDEEPVPEVPDCFKTNQEHSASFTVSLMANAASLYGNGSYGTGAEAAVVLVSRHSGRVSIELQAAMRVSSQNRRARVCVEENKRLSPQTQINQKTASSQSPLHNVDAVRIHAAKQAYPTNAEITFLAVADMPDPVEFVWHFGDSTSAKTNSRNINKRYRNPGSYNVFVVASVGQRSVTSDVFPLVVQRAARLNRLVHRASILLNQTVTVSCRVNAGTNLTFTWSFGDGTTKLGQDVEEHVFYRTGEFRVEVTASNLVSSASLSSHVFIVDRHCQPPPVKNMGPNKLQVRRYEVVRLGVTYETDVDCDASEGIHYTWMLLDSAGRTFPLPPTHIHNHSLTLQSHLLPYDTFTAIAKVQVIGSVVYSNYSVKVQVLPSQPAAIIQGGTNVFISRGSSNTVTLDGEASYDPDFPTNPLSYSWTCKPVSSISSSCFDQHTPTSSPVLKFPATGLKRNFDQFQFTLTVHSGERSASSETFVTVISNLVGRVFIQCMECRGEHVNWDQPFSVFASCEDCDTPAKYIRYSWRLHRVNASSKPEFELPFCYTVDLSSPSSIMENPVTPTQTAPTSAPQHPHTAKASENEPEKLKNSWTSSKRSRNTSNKDGLLLSERSAGPLDLDNNSNLYLEHFGQRDVISEFPVDPDSSADGEFYFPLLESGAASGGQDPDYGVIFTNAAEGDPGMSAGRPTGIDDEGYSGGGDSMFDPPSHQEEGSNLVDPKPSVVIRKPTLLDLARDSVSRAVFESYTYTGISSSLVSFRPFSLTPGSRYMIEVTAKSENSFLGRAQLFLKTNPAPKGMTCQVQPVKGMELHTHFSIFCTSGREDLLYKYSYSIRDEPPRVLYQGRDFHYYFSLPSGDPSDDFKVTIYTEIRSSFTGSATKPCPVTVQVQPSFLRDTSSPSFHSDPDQKLLDSGLRNLTALLQLGNNMETRNYIRLLSGILNRLGRDSEANTHAQTRLRSRLICTLCDLKSSIEAATLDTIGILKELLQFTNQVTLVSARRVTAYVQDISEQFSESRASEGICVNQQTLSSLISLLSLSLQGVITCEFTPETPNSADVTQPQESNSSAAKNIGDAPRCSKQVMQLVPNILQTASDVVLKSVLFQESQKITISSGLISIYAASQNQTSTVIRCPSATFCMPASLIQDLCVLRVVTELTHTPYIWATNPPQLYGPVVELNLFACSTKKKIPVRYLSQPISIVLQHPPKNRSSVHEFILLRTQVNYHSFNITQETLQQAVQLTVVFTPPSNNKAFPILLLFSMFDKPTPSKHHLHRIHHWRSNTTRITLPPSYLNAAGVGHLALFPADLGKTPRRKHRSGQISYSLSVDSSVCLSWHSQQRAWTHHGCRTQQTDADPAVNCSCHQLRPLTVWQQQLQSSHETADLDQFISASSDLTLLGVLLLTVFLFTPGLVACRRADATCEESQRSHYLSDNSPSDQYLYAVTVHTGLRSAARMSAKVYIVLHGENKSSHTKELQVPECTLFRRNSQDTFILSAADSLGGLWGVHIWHDNSGSSPDWYLKHIEVSEVTRGHVKGCSWLFVGQCWLAVNKGDGRVERTLHICSRGFSFTKMLCLKLSDYLSDFHIWASVYGCPQPNSFTHTQRLSVCLLLLLGYACANAALISLMDEHLVFELGFISLSAVSVKTGLLSVVAVLPAATLVSFLFRLCGRKPARSVIQHALVEMTNKGCSENIALVSDSVFEPGSSWNNKPGLVRGKEDALACQRPELQNVSLTSKGKSADEENQQANWTRSGVVGKQKDPQINHSRVKPASRWFCCLVWALCLLLSLCCLLLSALFGMRFSSSDVLLWIHSLFVSLTSCIFLIQPAAIFTVAVAVSCWHRERPDVYSLSSQNVFNSDVLRSWSREADQPNGKRRTSAFCSYPEKLLEARQRARFLRRVQPPAPAELRRSRRKRRREALMQRTLRDLSFCASMFFLMACITYGCSFRDRYQLNTAVRKQIIRNHYKGFMSIQTLEDLRRWTQTSLLDLLYKDPFHQTEMINVLDQTHILIGDPVLQTERSDTFHRLMQIVSPHTSKSAPQVSMAIPLRTCGHLGCFTGPNVMHGLGYTRSDATSKLKLLYSRGWLDGQTVALKVQFTLYSPAPNLFTSVTLLAEQSPAGVLLPAATVQSVRVFHTISVWDYVVMVCQLLFLFLSLLQLCHQVSDMWQQGLMGYWRTASNWAEASLLLVTLLYYVYSVYLSTLIMEVAGLLQRRSHRGPVDVSQLATCEQFIRTLRGVLLFLLTMNCVTVLRGMKTLDASSVVLAHSLSSLLWPLISGLIFVVALSCSGNLLYAERFWAFSSIPRSFLTLLHHYQGLRSASGLFFSGSDLLYCGVLHLSSTMIWIAAAVAVVSSSVRSVKQSQRHREAFTAAELATYIREKVSEFTGRHKQLDDNCEERKAYDLEEFESVVDELLFRLGALSDSLHHSLPPRAQRYRDRDSPGLCSEEMLVNEHTSICEHYVSDHKGALASSHLFKTGRFQKGQTGHKPSLETDTATTDKLSGSNRRACPQSASLKGLRTEDTFKNQGDQLIEGKDGYWLSQSWATQREVLVKVLIHEEPAIVEPEEREQLA